ncbi:glutathione S-transferase N-terminal domain-containing protein [Yunchengibacter salinarum]|uniref:glutathione S-transferase N-terminal domain-containing protein n=1 Tax=Yunchengibacter salinarum TaxID=3133399 RepID=UPI0035B69E49
MSKPLHFYATPFSLYSGKVRSYLRKAGIAFEERLPSHSDHMTHVVPRVGRVVLPTVTMADGTVHQDTTEIIDALEPQSRAPGVYPDSPRQRITALILELFGDEGLLRPAMHYRWHYREAHDHYLSLEFARAMNPKADGVEADNMAEPMKAQFSGYLPMLGVTAQTTDLIEDTYLDLLADLDRHFRDQPYLLGFRPCIADYGMIAPLYAHLGRDPVPAKLMKEKALRVWRWVERMQTAGADMPEFAGAEPVLLPDDVIPHTLKAVLRLVATDYLPELRALSAFMDNWLDRHGNEVREGAPVITEKGQRTLGTMEIDLRGTPVTVAARHFSLWMLQRVQDAYDGLDAAGRASVDALLAETRLQEIVTLRPARRIERKDYVEVWGAQRS